MKFHPPKFIWKMTTHIRTSKSLAANQIADSAYDMNFPPLGLSSKGKRGYSPTKSETPPSANYARQDDYSLPSSFGKKQHAKYHISSSGKKKDAENSVASSPPTSSEKQQRANYSKGIPELHGLSPTNSVYTKNADSGAGLQEAICLPQTRKSILPQTSCLEKNNNVQIEMENYIEGSKSVLRPGMVLLKGYLTLNEQVEIMEKCRELGTGSGGFYRPGYQNGAKLCLQMMCLGMNWDPQTKYGKKQRSDGSEPPVIPEEFSLLVKKALRDSHVLINQDSGASSVEDTLPMMTPNICIANFYTSSGRLGLHKDSDESRESLDKGLPVVSISVGDSAEFLYGDERDVSKATSILLESGDVLIFGGKSRHIFHGVSRIVPDSAPPDLLGKAGLRPGRLNLTFRQF